MRCHPDLAGKLAAAGQLTAESTNEQTRAGLLDLTPDEHQVLSSNNENYKKKFGFPFVICVRVNKKAAIMEGIVTRLQNTLEEEVSTGIGEVKKITFIRLCDLVDPKSEAKL